MVPHLSKCVYVAPDVKSRAITEVNAKKNRVTAIQNTSIGRSVSMPLSAIVFLGASFNFSNNCCLGNTVSSP